jgi:hypothetical protein
LEVLLQEQRVGDRVREHFDHLFDVTCNTSKGEEKREPV